MVESGIRRSRLHPPRLCAAQNYPSGPVKLIVPVPAGGVTDTMARIVGQRLNEAWNQS